MHAELLHPNEFLGAHDLRGRDVTLTIHDVRIEELTLPGGAKERKPVVHFSEMQNRQGTDKKRWILNKTNRRIIQRLHGNETDDWKGKRITLFPTKVEADGKPIRNQHNPGGEAIRVRPTRPAQSKPSEEPSREPGEDG